MQTVSTRLKVRKFWHAGYTSSADYLQRKHSIDALLLISLYQRSRMREMQPGMTTRSHRLWTWSRLEFFRDDALEVISEIFQAVTWGPPLAAQRSRQLQGR